MPTVIDMNANIVKPVFEIVQTGSGEFTHQIPEAFHSGFIRGEGEANERTKNSLDAVSRKLTDLNLSRVKLDPNHPNVVASGFAEINSALGECQNLLTGEAKRLCDALTDKANFKPDPTMKAMVVGTFQQMRPEQRGAAVGKLIEEGDGPTLAILASVSGVYTGLGDEVKSTIADRVMRRADDKLFGQLEDVRANLVRLTVASKASAQANAAFSTPMHKVGVANETHRSMIDQPKTGFGA